MSSNLEMSHIANNKTEENQLVTSYSNEKIKNKKFSVNSQDVSPSSENKNNTGTGNIARKGTVSASTNAKSKKMKLRMNYMLMDKEDLAIHGIVGCRASLAE